MLLSPTVNSPYILTKRACFLRFILFIGMNVRRSGWRSVMILTFYLFQSCQHSPQCIQNQYFYQLRLQEILKCYLYSWKSRISARNKHTRENITLTKAKQGACYFLIITTKLVHSSLSRLGLFLLIFAVRRIGISMSGTRGIKTHSVMKEWQLLRPEKCLSSCLR